MNERPVHAVATFIDGTSIDLSLPVLPKLGGSVLAKVVDDLRQDAEIYMRKRSEFTAAPATPWRLGVVNMQQVKTVEFVSQG